MKKLGMFWVAALTTLFSVFALFVGYAYLTGPYVRIPVGGMVCLSKFETERELRTARSAILLGGGNDCHILTEEYAASVEAPNKRVSLHEKELLNGLVMFRKGGRLYYTSSTYILE